MSNGPTFTTNEGVETTIVYDTNQKECPMQQEPTERTDPAHIEIAGGTGDNPAPPRTPDEIARAAAARWSERMKSDPELRDQVKRAAFEIYPRMIQSAPLMANLLREAIETSGRVRIRGRENLPSLDDVCRALCFASDLALRAAQQMIVSTQDEDLKTLTFEHCMFPLPQEGPHAPTSGETSPGGA